MAKGRALYWFKNQNADMYPLGRIIFSESILRLKHDDKCTITIQVPRKKYVLRARSSESMMEWFLLFQKAMNQHMKSQQIHSPDRDEPRRLSERPLPIGIPQDEAVESFGLMSGMRHHQKTMTESAL